MSVVLLYEYVCGIQEIRLAHLVQSCANVRRFYGHKDNLNSLHTTQTVHPLANLSVRLNRLWV